MKHGQWVTISQNELRKEQGIILVTNKFSWNIVVIDKSPTTPGYESIYSRRQLRGNAFLQWIFTNKSQELFLFIIQAQDETENNGIICHLWIRLCQDMVHKTAPLVHPGVIVQTICSRQPIRYIIDSLFHKYHCHSL